MSAQLTPQQASIKEKIDAVEKQIKEANEQRKALDRQLRWLKSAAPEINAEIIRLVEGKDDGTRQWVGQLRQQATDAVWRRHEAERKQAEVEAARKQAEADKIAAATATQGPEKEATGQQQ